MKMFLSLIFITVLSLSISGEVIQDKSTYCVNDNYRLVVFKNEINNDYTMVLDIYMSMQISPTLNCAFSVENGNDFFDCTEIRSGNKSTLTIDNSDPVGQFKYFSNRTPVVMECERGTSKEVTTKFSDD